MSDSYPVVSPRHGRTPGIIAAGVVAGLVFLGLGIWLWIVYQNTAVPRPYPSPYTNFWWGLVHGALVIPTFVWSLFAHSTTIYQAPNDGGWYNFGYVIGLAIAFGGPPGSRRARRRKR